MTARVYVNLPEGKIWDCMMNVGEYVFSFLNIYIYIIDDDFNCMINVSK